LAEVGGRCTEVEDKVCEGGGGVEEHLPVVGPQGIGVDAHQRLHHPRLFHLGTQGGCNKTTTTTTANRELR
jgi:hypothetical protein